jgi:hypothetical protein
MLSAFIVGCQSDDPFSVRLEKNNLALAKEICMSLGDTANFDTSARREILKDYGFSLAAIAEIEDLIGDGFDNRALCGIRLVSVAKQQEES